MPSRIQDVINARRRHSCRRINHWRVCATLTHGTLYDEEDVTKMTVYKRKSTQPAGLLPIRFTHTHTSPASTHYTLLCLTGTP
jgi:hypothetical protein